MDGWLDGWLEVPLQALMVKELFQTFAGFTYVKMQPPKHDWYVLGFFLQCFRTLKGVWGLLHV